MKKAVSAVLAIIILLTATGCVAIEQEFDDNAKTPLVSVSTAPDVGGESPQTSPPPQQNSTEESDPLITAAPEYDEAVPKTFEPSQTVPPDEAVTDSIISEEIDVSSTSDTESTIDPALDTRVITAPSVSPQGDITEIPKDKVIYLTFDDGPGKDTMRLLDILDKYNIKATFFVVNTSYSRLIAEEYKRGHSIGIHCNTHDYYSLYESDEAYFSDFNAIYDEIEKRAGVGTDLLRFPGGSSNTVSCFNPGIMTRLTEEVEKRGFTYFDWNVSSGDAGKTIETQQVFENVINGVKNHKYSIVLQHDKKGFSVDAVEQIIIWGLENGYTFLPLTKDSPTCHHKIAN